MTQQEFEHIAAELRDVMLEVGRNFFCNEADADDVAQEGLLTLWKLRDRLDANLQHRGLAIRIAKHCCMDMARKRARTVTMIPLEAKQSAEASPEEPSPHEQLEEEEMKQVLHDAIERLNPSERNLFELKQMEGLTNDEIAEQTHIPKSSIKVMVSTARKKVFEELKRRMKQ